MKTLILSAYLFVMSLMIVVGAFVAAGLPVTSGVVCIICFSFAFISFERIATLCGVSE